MNANPSSVSLVTVRQELVSVSEQLKLSAALNHSVLRLLVDARANQAKRKILSPASEESDDDWSNVARYKGTYLGTRVVNDVPEYGVWFEEMDYQPDRTFSTAQSAIAAAVLFHATYHLSQPRYSVKVRPLLGEEDTILCCTNSAREARYAFDRSDAGFEGGQLMIWDNHEQERAAWLTLDCEWDCGEIVSSIKRRHYSELLLKQIAIETEQRQDISERVRPNVGLSPGVQP